MDIQNTNRAAELEQDLKSRISSLPQRGLIQDIKVDIDKNADALIVTIVPLWSKELPNGEIMDFQSGRAPYALRWKEFWFSSDTIIVEMTHLKNKKIIDQVRERFSDFDVYCEHLLHRSYTIGSMVIFPVHVNSMNQRKGTN